MIKIIRIKIDLNPYILMVIRWKMNIVFFSIEAVDVLDFLK